MNSGTLHKDKIERAIRNGVEHDPPDWLEACIMDTVSQGRDARPMRKHPRSGLARPCRATLGAVLGVGLLCSLSFWGGLELGGNEAKQEVPGVHLPLPTEVSDAQTSFLLGRGMLAAGQAEQALAYFQNAFQRDPTVAEYSYWSGIAYWRLGKTAEERQSYGRVLQQSPDYVPSIVNLGHNFLEHGEYEEAVAQYDTVLKFAPDNTIALYNKGLAYTLLEDKVRAEQSFLSYLTVNRDGKWAERAVKHLQALDNFRFRSFRIGPASLAVDVQVLLADDERGRAAELARLSRQLQRVGESELHLVVFAENDLARARLLATELKKELWPLVAARNLEVKTSWFAVPEEIDTGQGKVKSLAESVLMFTKSKEGTNGRRVI